MRSVLNHSGSEYFSAAFPSLSHTLQYLLSDAPGTWCCRPRCEKPHRTSLHNHFRLSSSPWSSSAGADPRPWRMKEFINLGKIFVLFCPIQCKSENSHPGNRPGFSGIIALGFCTTLWQWVPWLSQKQSHRWCEENQTLTTGSSTQFLSMSDSMTTEGRDLVRGKMPPPSKPTLEEGSDPPSPECIPWPSPRHRTWKHLSGCTCKMPPDVWE